MLCWHYIFICFFSSSRETLREMPESLTIKRTIKSKLVKSVSQKSKHTPVSVWKRLKYRLSISLGKVSWSRSKQTSHLLVLLPYPFHILLSLIFFLLPFFISFSLLFLLIPCFLLLSPSYSIYFFFSYSSICYLSYYFCFYFLISSAFLPFLSPSSFIISILYKLLYEKSAVLSFFPQPSLFNYLPALFSLAGPSCSWLPHMSVSYEI